MGKTFRKFMLASTTDRERLSEKPRAEEDVEDGAVQCPACKRWTTEEDIDHGSCSKCDTDVHPHLEVIPADEVPEWEDEFGEG